MNVFKIYTTKVQLWKVGTLFMPLNYKITV